MRVIPVAAMLAFCGVSFGQDAGAKQATEAMAQSVMHAWPQGMVQTQKNPGSYGYEEGVLLDGLVAEWAVTHDPDTLAYIKSSIDKYVKPDGSIQMNATGKAFTSDEHQLDQIEPGRAILFLYRQTHEEKYAKAAKFLDDQLKAQPRTASGGYWHKTIYPNQMWLDGAYMAEPFRAAYATEFKQPADFDDIANQFLLIDAHMRDPKTGLLKHGWDESKQMPWADKTTGLSPEVWARALGWYCIALVDVLDWFPKTHPKHAALVDDLKRTMAAVVRYQESDGLWMQVMNHPGAGNYEETSASVMFVYALAKGVRLGYLPTTDATNARHGWDAIQKKFVKTSADGSVVLTGTVKVGGLGGKPYRSGTFEYYVGEGTGDDDAKGVGAYLLAGSEMERVKR